MMSFVQMTKSEVVKRQYTYKLKAYKGAYSSLMIIQIIGILFSFTSIMSGGGSGNSGFNYEFSVYSADIVVGFTLLWAFITGISITLQHYRCNDFAFVTNRKTSNLSNVLFLLTTAAIGGGTATLIGVAFRLLYSPFTTVDIMSAPFTISDIFIGIIATVLYCLYFSAIGYLAGMIIQYKKLFKYLLPIGFIGLWIGFGEVMFSVFSFFFMETSLLLFFLKIVVTAVLCFVLASVISNRMEVRK